MSIIAIIPARMGSQRLKKKNLREINGVPLITRAIRKCKQASCFDEIWVNSEDETFEEIANQESVAFYKRPEHLGDNNATSEDFVTDFLQNVDCTHLLQVHSIAPLLTAKEVAEFSAEFVNSDVDVMLSCIEDQIEVSFGGEPINFTFSEKTNSQDLKPIQRITWSITGWKKQTFLAAKEAGRCATYDGRIGFFPVSSLSGLVIKTEEDLTIAKALTEVM